MIAPVSADKFAAHEANVGFEGKVLGSLAAHGVRAHASDRGPSDKAIEIGDGTRFNTRGRQEHMKEWPARTEQLQAAGNRKGRSCGCAVMSVKVERGGACQFRCQQAGGGERSHSEASFLQEGSSAQQSLREVVMTWICRARGYLRREFAKTHDLLLGKKFTA